ncbi:MAG TPA: 2Fe-2S iron-sulfur cluster-binding protein [Thermoplasmata archaeon]|nr:2Fe-2S iron-sulfur cluster-binding protein [Thermoplasmata archaeon]
MTDGPARRFTYDGWPGVARPGETLAAALAHDGFPILERSVRYHRPRAPFCGVGQCTGCLVRVNGRPNVRACRYVPRDGDAASTEIAWPSGRFDLLGVLDLVFPNGLDTLHGFRRPAWATRTYQRVVRRLAGYGTAPDDAAAAALAAPGETRSVEVAVIGAGTSGRAAAARLVAAGLRPLVLDRALEAPALPGTDRLGATTVAFLPPPEADGRFALVAVAEPARGLLVSARAVVVATGAYDAGLLFGSNDRPGIVTCDGARALTGADGRVPFERAIVVGGGARAQEAVERWGSAVAAVVAPGEIPPELVRAASDRGIRLYPRSLVLAANGRRRVHSLELKVRGGGARFTLACDAVVLAHRRLPNAPLLFQAGARMHWRAGGGAYFPETDADQATSVPGLYAVGPVAGVEPASSAASGERAADRIAGGGPSAEPLARVAATGVPELEGYYRELLRAPRLGRWIACACEDVHFREVEEAHARGFRGIEVVKRYTSLGTGLCQGRYCVPDALLLLSLLEGRPAPEVGYLTQRPPTFPAPIAALAALPPPARPPEAA